MTVLVLGSGGREHALTMALARDPEVGTLHVAPGNAGTAAIATNHCVDPTDAGAVVALAREIGAELVVVGPEAPLVAGVGDAIRAAGIACFGPSAAAAQLEGSKAFAKDVMVAARVPTATARICETPEEAAEALDSLRHEGCPYVVKNDGLAAGKGVVVTPDRDTALAHAAACGRVVIEEYLDGPEVSLFAICDGTRAIAMQPAQDFKRAFDGDQGPNTGGMGAYTPLPWAPPGLADEVLETVVYPVLHEMAHRGAPFQGLLYVGLALTSQGLRVVEFNVRFGDPETQPLLSVLESPLGQVLYAAATGRLGEESLRWSPQSAVGVVLAADGYPGTPMTGGRLTVPKEPEFVHAGTQLVDGELVATGGRVLTVLGHGATLAQARADAYGNVERVDFPGSFHRHDIALAASREETA